ncbi:MAG: hypothetical protein ACRDOD_23805, partial [Streptosporangiaceae bacterium]
MHRLFARAIRDQTWRDAPAVAAEVIRRLVTGELARDLFTGAADTTALRRLEGGQDAREEGEAARAAGMLPDGLSRGLLWHGLGHIRERRGPVRESAPHFWRALAELDREKCPYQVAEAMIGLARVTYQDPRSTNEELTQARASIEPARVLLAPLSDDTARQLSEQGNALSWLITRTLAGRTPDLVKKAGMLAEVRDQLWLSYEQRLRIARRLGDEKPLTRSAPIEKDGIGPERAYYNLAGTNLLLARAYHELAGEQTPEKAEGLRAQARDALDQTEAVYEAVRVLREVRYRGRAHPHLAACVNGLGLVAYYRATLLGDAGRIPDAIGYAAAAFEQRRQVADDAIGGSDAGVLR